MFNFTKINEYTYLLNNKYKIIKSNYVLFDDYNSNIYSLENNINIKDMCNNENWDLIHLDFMLVHKDDCCNKFYVYLEYKSFIIKFGNYYFELSDGMFFNYKSDEDLSIKYKLKKEVTDDLEKYKNDFNDYISYNGEIINSTDEYKYLQQKYNKVFIR